MRVGDVTSIHRAFLRKPFYLRALELKGTRPQVPAGIDLTDVRSLLSSIERNYPLIPIHRDTFPTTNAKSVDSSLLPRAVTPSVEYSASDLGR